MDSRAQRFIYITVSVAAIYAVWLLTVTPNGDFPLNDDWAYAWSVRRLLDTGHLRLSEWSSATSLFPVYWGALFSQLAGAFSFAALRWSTLTVSIIGCLAIFDLLRQGGLPFRSAWLGTITLAVNPLYIYLSYTFMSDVFYFTPMVLSLSFYTRGVMRGSASALLIGSLFAAVAYLARQLGITLPVAAALALLLRDRQLRLRPIALAVVIPFLVFVCHTLWLQYVHGLPWGFKLNAIDGSLVALLQPTKLIEVVWRLLVSTLYLGIFTLPALAALVPGLLKDRERLTALAVLYGKWLVGLAVLVVVIVGATGLPMPYLRNVINRAGIGTLTLAGQKPAITPPGVFWLITICAPFAGAALAAVWTEAVLKLRRQGAGAVMVIASILMAVLTAMIVTLWDEYLLVFIPAALYLTLKLGPITWRGAAIGVSVCAVIFVYSLREMADHMAWNAARWSAGRQLLARGVPAQAIDGGFEWAGWYEFESALPLAIATGKGSDLRGWMDVTPKEYRLSFSPLDEGHAVVATVPYGGSALVAGGRIYVLKPPPEEK